MNQAIGYSSSNYCHSLFVGDRVGGSSPEMTSPEVASPEMTSPDMTSPEPEVVNWKPEMKGR
jgi:hypothetical protein